MTNFLPYAHQSIDASDIAAVESALRQNVITRGDCVAEFERQWSEHVGARHAVAFSNGSAALYAAFQAGQVGSNDHVVTSPNTFIATVAGAWFRRLPGLVDIDENGNMDVRGAAGQLREPRTEANRCRPRALCWRGS